MIPAPAFAAAEVRPTAVDRLHPAVRLGGAALGMASAFVLPAPAVPAALAAPALLLAAGGLGASRQARAAGAWWPVALLVLAIHTLTTTSAAPLGHPSTAGVLAGATALVRVAASVAWLALLMRTTGLDDLAAAVRWWGRPLRRLGWRDDDLPLVLMVAVGTAPTVLGEARRIEAVLRLRRGPTAGRGPGAWWRRTRDRARVVVPLLETLARRGEALSLSLARRRPSGATGPGPRAGALLGLAVWAAALAALAAWRAGAGR